MATTTNFGWETPDDTDLVKDGALAIRTLGSAIDTSLVDLKGGTTGQLLSKNSNTDMDFTWTTPSTGDLVKIQKTTIGSGVSTVSLNNVFTTTYSNYRVVIQYEGCSASGPTINFRLRLSGTDNSGATAYQPRGYANTTSLATFGSAGSSFALGRVDDTDQSFTLMEIIAPASARATNFTVNHYNTNNNYMWHYGATHNVTTAYDGFTIYPSSGTLTSGTITVYGYKD